MTNRKRRELTAAVDVAVLLAQLVRMRAYLPGADGAGTATPLAPSSQ